MARRLEPAAVLAAVLVIPAILLQTSSYGEPWRSLGSVLNWAIWLVFTFELVAMLAVVPDRRRWLRQHPVELVVVILTPPFLPASLTATGVLRLLRLALLVRLAPMARRLLSFDGLRYAALLAFLTALGGGTAFSVLEGRGQSVWDGVWWSITTMTTVGYGDIFPRTDAGRVLGVVVMLVGIGFTSLLVGATAQRFLTPDVEELEESEDEVLRRLIDISQRLERLELAVGPATSETRPER